MPNVANTLGSWISGIFGVYLFPEGADLSMKY